jgi:class 3 adenylate cyclase
LLTVPAEKNKIFLQDTAMTKEKTDSEASTVKGMGAGSFMSRLNRTFICSVVFLDIVEYTKKSVDEQIRLKDHLNKFVIEAIKDVAVNDRLILDTGDGAAISFLGDPEDALFVALSLRDAILEDLKTGSLPLAVRIGMNLGPVKLVKDINGRPNLIGDGINVAQRVMAFAQPGQILVSRSYYEVVSCLSQEYARLFHYLGMRADKHIREHELYVVEQAKEEGAKPVPDDKEKKGAVSDKAAAVPPSPSDQAQMSGPIKEEVPPQPSPSGPDGQKVDEKIGQAAPLKAEGRSTKRPGGGSRKIFFVAIPAAIGLIVAGLLILKPKFPEAMRDLKDGQTDVAPDLKTEESLGKQLDKDPTVPKQTTMDIAVKASAFILLDIQPNGEVYVDGKMVGSSPPLEFVQITPGRHKIEIKKSSYKDYTQNIELKPSENIKISHVFR